MKNPWMLIGAVAVVLFGAAFWYSSQVGERANEGVKIEPLVKGNPEATVVLEEFSDFQCPACGAFFPVVKDLMDTYGDQVRFEYRHFPLVQIHPFAEPAARAAEAAGQQGKFFEYHDLLFENQDQWANSANPSRYFAAYAEELELDMDQFSRQQRSSLIRDRIRAELAAGLERGVNSTPTFFLNGQKLTLNTYADLQLAVEEALGIEQVVAPAGALEGEGGTTTPAGAATSGAAEVQFGI